MSVWSTIQGKNASIFKENRLIYIHCVSDEDFFVVPCALPCEEQKTRIVHVSFPEKVSSVFSEVRSPALLLVVASCDLKVIKYCFYIWWSSSCCT